MDNLIAETNSRLLEIIANLTTIKQEYEEKLNANTKEIDTQLEKVQEYKTEFFESKAKIEKMNSDIEGFESDYKKLVERFKDDELANILIAANKEISLKIDERKRKIVKDKSSMNELVDKAENVKQKLVKLTAEKKALELCLSRILDAFEFYSRSLNQIISYSNDNKDNLCSCFHDGSSIINSEIKYISSSFTNEDSIDLDLEDTNYTMDMNNTIDTNEEYTAFNQNEDILVDVEDEKLDDLEPIDLSDMVKVDEENPEISDYDNESIIEGDEHRIVINSEDNLESEETTNDVVNTSEVTEGTEEGIVNTDEVDDETTEDGGNTDEVPEQDSQNKGNNKKKKKKKEEENISIDVNFDDSLEDDDSLYE